MTEQRFRNPFASLRGFSSHEWAQVALMFTFFFLVISVFWILKPVRTAVLLSVLGAEETPILKILAIAMIALVVAGYSRLVDLVGRCQIVFIAILAFIALFGLAWGLLSFAPEGIRTARSAVYAIYLLADLFSTVMVVVFWSYVNDTSGVGFADRAYGPIGLGGIMGGITGGVAADALSEPLGPGNLLLICVGLTTLLLPLVWTSDRMLGRTGTICTAGIRAAQPGAQAAIEGARLAWRNVYLLLIVVVLAGYEVISTMNDFVLNAVLDHAYDDEAQISQVYGRLGWVVNTTALLTQLILVPALLPNKSLALLFTPAAMLAASVGFLGAPSVLMAFPLIAADNGLNYSMQQSTKETLYVPLSQVEKYKSKAFIDMFVFRAAKALAAVAFLLATFVFGNSLRLPMLLNLAVLGVWLVAATKLARVYRRRYAPGPAASRKVA